MTKQDYEYIACMVKMHIQSIKEETQYTETDNTIAEVKYAIGYMVKAMQNDNPRFDVDKFYKACGL